jgi:hypothetical protein
MPSQSFAINARGMRSAANEGCLVRSVRAGARDGRWVEVTEGHLRSLHETDTSFSSCPSLGIAQFLPREDQGASGGCAVVIGTDVNTRYSDVTSVFGHATDYWPESEAIQAQSQRHNWLLQHASQSPRPRDQRLVFLRLLGVSSRMGKTGSRPKSSLHQSGVVALHPPTTNRLDRDVRDDDPENYAHLFFSVSAAARTLAREGGRGLSVSHKLT